MTGGFPDSRIGGTNSYKVGSLKRRLDPVIVANLSSAFVSDVLTPTQRLVLKGLSGDLNVHIAAAPVGLTDSTPILPSAIAAGFATMQLTPVIVCGNQAKIYLRPVFQNPFAAAPNSNNPLPQDLPFGWEFSTEADEVYIDIAFNDSLVPSNANGNVVVQATVEYNGQWWDTKAIQAALGQVQLTDCQTLILGTAPS